MSRDPSPLTKAVVLLTLAAAGWVAVYFLVAALAAEVLP